MRDKCDTKECLETLQKLCASRGKKNPFRSIRKAFGVTQAEAAKRVEVSRSLWLAWERRERPITVVQLGRIVQAFSLERNEVQWVVDWWGDALAAQITVAQMNSLFSLIGTEDFELVDVLFALWGEGGNGVK